MWVAIYGVLICPLCIFVPSVIQFLQGWFIITNYNFKQTFPPIIWIFTEGDEIKSMLSFKIFSTLRLFFSHLQSTYTEKISITEMTHALCWKFKKKSVVKDSFQIFRSDFLWEWRLIYVTYESIALYLEFCRNYSDDNN